MNATFWTFLGFVYCLTLTFILVTVVDAKKIAKNSSTNYSKPYNFNEMFTDCIVETVDPTIASKVDQLVEEGAKVVYINFHFQNLTGPLLEENKTKIYRPLSWVRTTGRHGRGLLLLRPQYEILSLWSLRFGIEMLDVTLKQTPSYCLTKQNATIVAKKLEEFLLYKFRTPSTNVSVKGETLTTTEHICNLNIEKRSRHAAFYYNCCQKNEIGETLCQELQSDKYVTILFIFIFMINFVAVVFSPLLIPEKLYRKKYGTTSYEHRLKLPIILSVRKMSFRPKEKDAFPISYFDEMEEFKKTLKELRNDITYQISLKRIDIKTENDRLLPSDRAPVGLWKSLHAACVKCEIRDRPSMTECCNSNMFGAHTPCNYKFPWYKCLRRLMQIVMYVFISTVWIIRLYFFFKYEETDRHEREHAATLRSLRLPYTGNLTWYLTPIHVVFIVCYGIFLVDLILFGILSQQVKDTLKHVLRKCLRDMRELSRTRAIGWSMQILMYPFKEFGFFGIFLAWFYYIIAIPVVLLTITFYCLPTINLLVRVLMYFVVYLLPYGQNCFTQKCGQTLKRWREYIYRVFRMDILVLHEQIERPKMISMKNRFLQLFVIIACLLTILSLTLLCMECIIFIVEIVMYTIIGVILNTSNTLKYLTLIFLITFYARDSFSTIKTEYLNFNKFLNSYLVDKMRAKVEKITLKNHILQRNTAFQASIEDNTGDDDKPVTLSKIDGKLKWEIPRLVLFLDKNDTPYITAKFFFDACNLGQTGCPGTLFSSFLRAMQRFLLICVFLFFVVVVILAFGEEYGISATNQMFATLAGGFLPYILRFVLFNQPQPVQVDPNNLSFRSKFQRMIENYSQSWVISDMRIEMETKEDLNVVEQNHVEVIDEENRSNENEAMLKNITPIIKNDTTEKIDILIFDRSTV